MSDSNELPNGGNQSNTDVNLPELPGAFELLKPSWKAIKLNFITLFEFIVFPVMLSLVGFVTLHLHSSTIHSNAESQLFNILPPVVSLMLGPGLIYTLLLGAKGKKIDFYPAFQAGLKFFWRFLALTICVGFVVVIGFILLIVPGLFMLRRYYLAPYYLIDRNLGVFEAMKASKDDSVKFSGAVWGVILVQLLFGVLIIIPIIGWIGGTILSIMYYSAPAVRYEQIKLATGSKSGISEQSTAPTA